MSVPTIYILHENPEWVIPLTQHLEALGFKYEEWLLNEGLVDLDGTPPTGIFYNRMSASSHTRNNRYAPELTLATLHWLAKNGRRVLNNHNALHLEINKIAQYRALQAAGVRVPRTVAAVGRENIIKATKLFKPPFVLKPNRGGKGAGVFKCESTEQAVAYIDKLPPSQAPIDGIQLVQQYITASEPYITRCELIGRNFKYAVRVDTSSGFELCPADHCEIDTNDQSETPPDRFSIIDDFNEPDLLERYLKVMWNNGIHVAGFEFVRDTNNEIYTYDLNTNTNYNTQAERNANLKEGGMKRLANYLSEEAAGLAEARTVGSGGLSIK